MTEHVASATCSFYSRRLDRSEGEDQTYLPRPTIERAITMRWICWVPS
jgi:hypothetical protein